VGGGHQLRIPPLLKTVGKGDLSRGLEGDGPDLKLTVQVQVEDHLKDVIRRLYKWSPKMHRGEISLGKKPPTTIGFGV